MISLVAFVVTGISPTDRHDWVLEHIPTAALLAFLCWYEQRKGGRPLSDLSYALLSGFVLLHLVGAHYLYSNVPYDDWTEALLDVRISEVFGATRNHYDRFVHLGFGLLVLPPMAELAWRHVTRSRFWGVVVAIAFIGTLSQLYEFAEWIIALVMSPEAAESYNGQQGDAFDPIKDMVSGVRRFRRECRYRVYRRGKNERRRNKPNRSAARTHGSKLPMRKRNRPLEPKDATREELQSTIEELEARVLELTREARASHWRLQAIVETAADAIVTIDERGVIDLFNPSAERMFGFRADEVLGHGVSVLMPEPFASEHDEYLNAYLESGEKKIIGIGREVTGKRKDGSTFPVDLAVSEIKAGQPSRFVGTMRDLTAVKDAAAELRKEHAISEGILSTARVIILRLDRDGRIMTFNPYLEELCGYKLDEVKGKDWFTTFIPQRHRENIKRLFATAIEGRRTRGNINPIVTKEGAEVLVEWYDAVLTLQGEPLSLIAIGHNVTERNKLQSEFVQAQKMEAVGRLAGGVAHDFNNLLTGVASGLRIAAAKLDAEHPAKQMLAQVEQEVERGSSITRRLLDFSRAGRPRPSLFDPRETLRAGEQLLCRLIGEDVEIRLACDSSHSRIHGDAGQLEQAVLNLAINARDAMPRGEISRFDVRT